MRERVVNWRRLVVVYGTIFAALAIALVLVEHSGPATNLGAGPAGYLGARAPQVSTDNKLVGSSSTKVSKVCEGESPRCATAPASGTLNGDCPTGQTLIAKFEFIGGKYVFEKPAGNENIVKITGNNIGGTFTSTVLIKSVAIKASTDVKVITYGTGVLGGSFDNSGMRTSSGQLPDISNIRFCG